MNRRPVAQPGPTRTKKRGERKREKKRRREGRGRKKGKTEGVKIRAEKRRTSRSSDWEKQKTVAKAGARASKC